MCADETATGSVAALPASIWQHCQSTLPDGRVIVNGGNSSNANITRIYTPSSNTWETTATMSVGLYGHGQSVLNDGRIVISGGWDGNNYCSSTYIYGSDTNGLVSANPMPAGFQYHGQSTLNDGRVMVSGGWIGSGIYRNTAYIYNSNNNAWIVASPMPASFLGHGQSTLNNGKVLVSGGGSGSSWSSPRNIVYTYDAVENKWTTVASLPISITGLRQSALFDGRVLTSGGNGSVRNGTYIYTPNASNGSWVNASPVPTASIYVHGQSTLADGRVLVSGGTTNTTSGLSTAYIYTPAGWEDFQANHSGTELINSKIKFCDVGELISPQSHISIG